MPNVLGSGAPFVVASSAPSVDPEALTCTTDAWKWLNTTNGRFYQLIDSTWTLVGAGLNLDVTEEVKITHIKIENGLVTELEYE